MLQRLVSSQNVSYIALLSWFKRTAFTKTCTWQGSNPVIKSPYLLSDKWSGMVKDRFVRTEIQLVRDCATLPKHVFGMRIRIQNLYKNYELLYRTPAASTSASSAQNFHLNL